jgi:hypothetical protein
MNAAVTNNWPKFDWRRVESEDYESYVKNLRDIGCPAATIRDIVTADVLQAYARQRSNTAAAIYGGFNYWDTEPTEVSRRDALHRRRREVDDEMAWVLGQLLGDATMPPETSREWQAAVLEQQLTFLPAEKRYAVRDKLMRIADNEAQLKAVGLKRPPTRIAADLGNARK